MGVSPSAAAAEALSTCNAESAEEDEEEEKAPPSKKSGRGAAAKAMSMAGRDVSHEVVPQALRQVIEEDDITTLLLRMVYGGARGCSSVCQGDSDGEAAAQAPMLRRLGDAAICPDPGSDDSISAASSSSSRTRESAAAMVKDRSSSGDPRALKASPAKQTDRIVDVDKAVSGLLRSAPRKTKCEDAFCSANTPRDVEPSHAATPTVPTARAEARLKLEGMMQELFGLHDLNQDGVLDELELIKLNQKIALLHHGKDADKGEVKAKFTELFRSKLDPEGRPVPFETFRAYMQQVLVELDKDVLAQEYILEQFILEARSGRLAFHCKSFESASDVQFRRLLEMDKALASADFVLTESSL
eukprot:TRINITY_DN35718_c0_g2_i2.p1 TRINITY_DN35718_c0_g2~~TRINITY_DN35718_c0_g2_i2.p1  ORF type:complete len:387 (+),score=91.07 TRINITY_DN35718_c0_g2_i2:88-1161(+)